MRPWLVAPVFAASVSALACSLEPIDVSAKRCPCAQGYECNVAIDRCEPNGEPTCAPAVTVAGFRGSWATANVIRWDWEPSGDRDSFVRYEIEIAEDPMDLGTERAVVFGPDDNPELGGYVLQRTGGADDVVTHTMTDGHVPRATYAARIVAVDTSLCEFRSEVFAVTTTLDPPEELVLFRDASSPGSPFPGTIRIAGDGTDAFLEHDPSSDMECIASGEGVCSQNLRFLGIGASGSAISAGEFANTAMLEVAVANDTDLPSFFSRVWIRLGDGRIFRLEPFTFRNRPDYRVLQVPLRELRDGENALTHADLQASPIDEVNVGGQWSRCAEAEAAPCTGGRVRIDEARIRY